MTTTETAATAPPAASPTVATNTDQKRPLRRPRAPEAAVDAEALIRGVVAKIQGQGSAEAERVREGIRKAIAVLQAVLGS